MIPQLALVKEFLVGSKWLLLATVLLVSHVVAYTAGQKSEIRKQVETSVQAVLEERKDGAKAVKQASSDAGRLANLERENEDLRTQLSEATAAGTCIGSPDELRVLGEIADRTRLND